MAKSKRPARRRFQVSARDRGQLTLNLALLLGAAVPVVEAVESLIETTPNKRLRKALHQTVDDLNDGLSLSRAFAASGLASDQTIELIRAGENSGKLQENLRVAAAQEEKQRIFASKVRSALIYPAVVLSLTVIVGLGISWFLLPKLSVTFEQLGIKLPLISRLFLGFGAFLKHDGWWAVPLAAALVIVGFYLLFGNRQTRGLGQRLILHLPGIGSLVRDLEVARFGYLLGMLLDAGLTVMQAWPLLIGATASPRYKRLYRWLDEQFEAGFSFRATLKQRRLTGRLLPPTVQQMIIAGERSGTLPETLLTVGKMYEERADVATANLEATLEPILLIIMAVGVMAIAIAVILPIYSLIGGLNQ